MFYRKKQHVFSARGSALFVLAVLIGILTWHGNVLAQPDICGCEGNPNSLGAFVSADDSTYPPGTVFTYPYYITIPMPEDGILIFDSFTIDGTPAGYGATVNFEPNTRNTPVTLLVAGDVTITGSDTLNVNGQAGIAGSNNYAGTGGMGGPGGFRGGDGAYQWVNHAVNGGAGFGPGGGEGGTEPSLSGTSGTFVGIPELLPMIGGSGGGGGASTNPGAGCSGGGGGGGGGAILIVANGTITVNGNLRANAGSYSSNYGAGAGDGARGSGGAIRLVAETITGNGSIHARGYDTYGNRGAIRMEAITNDMPVNATDPIAVRIPAPGPISNPLVFSVSITEFNGNPVPDPPEGGIGEIDFTMSTAGTANIALETSGVPSGTTILVTVKPRVGGTPVEYSVTLAPANCSAGNCTANAAFDLASGKYVIEAKATFQAP